MPIVSLSNVTVAYELSNTVSKSGISISSEVELNLPDVRLSVTPDVNAPVFSGVSVTNVGTTTATLQFTVDEPCTVRYLVSSTTPVADGDITSSGTDFVVNAAGTSQIPISGLVEGTSYYIGFYGTDSSSNKSTPPEQTSQFTTVVTDVTAPVISITGENPLYHTVGLPYVDAGATAVDNVDGAVTVTTTGTVDGNNPVVQTLTYTAEDSAGNESTATRTVYVQASTTLTGVTVLATRPMVIDVSPTSIQRTATDIVFDLSDTDAVATTGNVVISNGNDTLLVTNVSSIGTDAYRVTATCEDDFTSKYSDYTWSVTVVDQTTSTGLIPLVPSTGKSFVDVVDPVTTEGSVYHNYTGAAPVTGQQVEYDSTTSPTGIGVSVAPNGVWTLTEYPTDQSQNETFQARVIGTDGVTYPYAEDTFISDREAPVIVINGDNPVYTFVGQSYTDLGASASDNVDGDITGSVSVTDNVDTSVSGVQTVEYSVSDVAGNSTTATREVYVQVQLDLPNVTLNTKPMILDSVPTTIRSDSTVSIQVSNVDNQPTVANTRLQVGVLDLTPTIISGSNGVYSLTFDVPLNVAQKFGSYSWMVSVDAQSSSFTADYLPVSGRTYVDITTPNTDEGSIFYQYQGLPPSSGQQVEYDLVTIPSGIGVTVDGTGQWILQEEPPLGVNQSFSARVIGVDGTLYSEATFSYNVSTQSGSGDITLEDVTAEGVGFSKITGTLLGTLENVVATSETNITINATGNSSIADITSDGEATVTVSGSISASIPDVVASSIGSVGGVTAGILEETLDNITSTGEGTITVKGNVNRVIQDITVAADVAVINKGSVSATLDNVTGFGIGEISQPVVTGSLNVTLDDITARGTDSPSITGSIIVTLDDITSESVAYPLVITTVSHNYYDTATIQEIYSPVHKLAQGGSYDIVVNVMDENGNPIDLTGVVQIRYEIASSVRAPDAYFSKDISSPDVSIIDAKGGVVRARLHDEETSLIPEGNAYHELQVVDILGNENSILSEVIAISPRRFKNS